MNQQVDVARRVRPLPTADDFARAKVAYAAGEGIEHIVVGQWLLTWGKPGRKSLADWLNDQDG